MISTSSTRLRPSAVANAYRLRTLGSARRWRFDAKQGMNFRSSRTTSSTRGTGVPNVAGSFTTRTESKRFMCWQRTKAVNVSQTSMAECAAIFTFDAQRGMNGKLAHTTCCIVVLGVPNALTESVAQ